MKDESHGRAANRVKSNYYFRIGDLWGEFVSMEGVISRPAFAATRIRTQGPNLNRPGTTTSQAYTLLLFDGQTGKFAALLRQKVVSSYRTASAAGLGARSMARATARVVGMLGSGWMAHTHAMAYAHVRQIEKFKVYSPNPEHRTAFARWIQDHLGVAAEAFDGPEAVVRGSDIVAGCTSGRGHLVQREWLDVPGVHVTAVRVSEDGELPPSAMAHFQRLVAYPVLGTGEANYNTEPDLDPPLSSEADLDAPLFAPIPNRHSLNDLLLGRVPGRESEAENNFCFSHGNGVVFAAIAALAYQRALERGVGQVMPPEMAAWFAPNDSDAPGKIL